MTGFYCSLHKSLNWSGQNVRKNNCLGSNIYAVPCGSDISEVLLRLRDFGSNIYAVLCSCLRSYPYPDFSTVQNHQMVSLRAADALPAAWQSPFRQANFVNLEIASGKTPSHIVPAQYPKGEGEWHMYGRGFLTISPSSNPNKRYARRLWITWHVYLGWRCWIRV